MNRYRRIVGLLVIAQIAASGLAHSQGEIRASQYKSPSWIKAKWTQEDRDLRAIREKIESLWLSGKVSDAQVKVLFDKNVLPYEKEIRLAKHTGKLAARPYFWLIALTAYFPSKKSTGEWKVKGQPGILLDTVPVPPSYEFVRVAFCTYLEDAEYRAKNPELATRLLTKWPKDPLARWYTVQMGIRMNGLGEWQKKAPVIAKSLVDEYPQKETTFLPTLMLSYYMLGRSTRQEAHFKQAFACMDRILASPKFNELYKRDLNSRVRQLWIKMAKASGVTIKG